MRVAFTKPPHIPARGRIGNRQNWEDPLTAKIWLRDEPSIDEMLDDPIVRLLMQRDGVSDEELRALSRRCLGRPWRRETSIERPLVA